MALQIFWKLHQDNRLVTAFLAALLYDMNYCEKLLLEALDGLSPSDEKVVDTVAAMGHIESRDARAYSILRNILVSMDLIEE
jgi:hypothetical protein